MPMIIRHFTGLYYVGAAVEKADKDKTVFAFDLDSTLTYDPDRSIAYESKDAYFDAARDFGPNQHMLNYARYFVLRGHRVAIATARPASRLNETIDWLNKYDVPFDQIMLSTDQVPSSLAKQSMLQNLQRYYKRVGCLYDDSPWNIEAAELQGVYGRHVPTNCQYWRANPEDVRPLLAA